MVIKLKEVLGTQVSDKTKWAGLAFTPDEDLILVSNQGLMYTFDMTTGLPKHHKPQEIGMEFLKDPILDLKLEGTLLLIRTQRNEFYWKDL